ncbi:hypothetical protein FHX37_1752 [Haloactinospora alba]|uniref:Uncharacterized protein n=1 Tax=Haloactinospora alba TaxID=405555 RepID=A0A543NJ04_9ACTN|nr:hypothetical protein [Haloactinospora alba]TQN31831.1 hypothetical protein FHX37_1752 [Haloactinospora alba]
MVRRSSREKRGGTGTAEEALPLTYRRYVGERPAYWLLYVVAFSATMAHWESGNSVLALLCAAGTLLGAGAILHTYRGSAGRF